jgi:hypothetical protein
MEDGTSSGEPEFLPYYFGHDACGCTFIDDAPMNCDVLDLNWYLKGYQSGEAWFSCYLNQR